MESNQIYTARRDWVFLLLAGLFLGSLTMLNVLGITKFVDFSFEFGSLQIPFKFSIGVLPYPITFLCTDLISELYGEKKANQVVWVGLLLNLWVLFVIWLGDLLPSPAGQEYAVFEGIKNSAYACTIGSMLAYLLAQFIDVRLFHFIKKKTKGKRLWLRNNGSTMISQLVDTVAVVLVVYIQSPSVIPVAIGQGTGEAVLVLIVSMYVFKFFFALLDTFPFYFLTHRLRRYLNLEI